MAISLASLNRRNSPKVPICTFYGPPGWGKTTFACGSDSPVLLAIEDGVGLLQTEHWSLASFDEVMEAMAVLATEEHGFKSLVIDSLDWLESLIWRKVCADNHWDNISQPDYGKGYGAADVVWDQYFNCIEYLRDHKRMMILQLAHSEIKTYKSPDTDHYDQHQIKLHKNAAAKVREHSDIIGYTGYRVSVKEVKGGFSKTKQGVGIGQHVLHLQERPSQVSKNRFSLPATIDIPFVEHAHERPELVWAPFAAHLPQFAA